jgi:hypothetical protein
MKNSISILDRIAGATIAAALFVAGAGFIVLGVSLLPVIGIFIGAALLEFAWHFLAPNGLDDERGAVFSTPGNITLHPGHAWAAR